VKGTSCFSALRGKKNIRDEKEETESRIAIKKEEERDKKKDA